MTAAPMRSFVVLLSLGAASAGCTVGADLACYIDDQARVLADSKFYQGPLSLEYCAQLCSDRGFLLAGAEAGNQCFCGNATRADAKLANSSECSTQCLATDHPDEKCGGYWRISILKVDCSGSPEPKPVAPAYVNNPCLDASKPFAKQPWCDPTLPVDDRVADMISRMTITEKINALDTDTNPTESLGLNGYNWWSEATHGISHVRNDDKTPYETNFAFPITTAMAFNRSLWKATGAAIGREARAFMNAGNAWSTYWAPVINLAREPRWGRNIETPGEDPYLTGEYATAFVRGFEVSEDDPTHLQASACCKHYVANSMEASTVAGQSFTRHNFNANISMQDLVDSYLLPFQACVEKGKVSGLMCSYNAVNGVPSCANNWLLQTVAREAWGFDGYITSDCGADQDVYDNHHYKATPEETVKAVLGAGTDVDCTSFVGAHAQSALDQKLITEKDMDVRLAKLFRVRMRLSHFDPLGPLNAIPTSDVCSAATKALARAGTAQGATLIKNEGKALPLKVEKLTSLAVIGPNSRLSTAISSYYGGNNCDDDYPSILDAITERVPGTVSADGVPSVTSADTSQVAAAAAMAAKADVTVLVLGTDLSIACEGKDAVNITFSAGQLALVDAVAKASKEPVIVLTLTAVPLDLTPILSNPKVGAILHLGQPSIQTRGATDVLFGDAVPAGRMIQTIYPGSYQDQISIFDFGMRPGPSPNPRPDCAGPATSCPRGTNPGRTHRFYTGKPVVPFGHGLSYTVFKYEVTSAPTTLSLAPLPSLLASSRAHAGVAFPPLDGPPAGSPFEVTVTNTGDVDADEVVLGFLTPPGAGKGGVPLQSLFGFERVFVKAGASVSVFLYPSLTDLLMTDASGDRHPLPGVYKASFGLAAKGMAHAEVLIRAEL